MPTRPRLICQVAGCRAHALPNTPRCEVHERQHQAERNARREHYHGTWPALSKALIRRHVEQHGWVCPGFERPAHPSTDLTTDHVSEHEWRVLCRSCNGRRGAKQPVFRR